MMAHRTTLAAIVAFALVASMLPAQDPDYVLSLSDAQGLPFSVQTIAVTFDITGEGVQGFSFGVCHDQSGATPVEVTPGEALQTVNDGGPPDFVVIDIWSDGVTMGVVIDFFGGLMQPSVGNEILLIDYLLDSPPGPVVPLNFCDTVGEPPVQTAVVLLNGGYPGIMPTTNGGLLLYDVDVPAFTYTAPSLSVGFEAATGQGDFSVSATIGENPDSSNPPNDTYAFSMALAHNPDLIVLTNVVEGTALGPLNGGSGPDFFSANILANGVTIGTVYNFTDPTVVLQFTSPEEVIILDYETNAPNLENQMNPIVTTLSWQTLGNPPVSNRVAISLSGETVTVFTVDGVVTLVPGGAFFIRGDCTAEGSYDIGDPLALLGSLFGGTGPVFCEDGCDFNDDGGLDLGDAIGMLMHQFSGAPAPEAPYPACGADPSLDALACPVNTPAC